MVVKNALLMATVLTIGAGQAHAQSAAGVEQFFASSCERFAGQDLPLDETLASIIASGSPRWSADLARAYQATLTGGGTGDDLTLADQFREENSTWDTVLRVIYGGAYSEEFQTRSSVIQITRRKRGLEESAWVRAYLDGDLNLLTVHCPERQNDQASAAPSRRLIITGDISGLSAPRMADRTFATASYTNDREAGNETYNVDVVLGLGPFDFGPARWVPYASYERQTRVSAPVNDLTFGVAGFWQRNYHHLRWNAAYETDDEFESAVWTADIEWSPPPPRGCVQRIGNNGIFRCDYSLRLDYSLIEDPGAKASLANVSDFLRIGGQIDFSYGRPFSRGWLEATASYVLMEPIDGDYGDAARGEVAIALRPRDASNFEFGISYSNGEDLSSLVRSDIVKVYLGVRY